MSLFHINDVIENKLCLACGSNNIHACLDLGDQPLANIYPSELTELQTYPLAVNLCHSCFHVQLTHSVNPELIYRDYPYVSGTTNTLNEYFRWFANYANQYVKDKTVLDIGCNDGSQLDAFKNLDYVTIGIDPAENIISKAESEKSHSFHHGFFDSTTTEKLKDYGPYGAILAQNVFAHNPDPLKFLDNAKQLMDNDSLLFIQTSQANMIKNSEFDTIYHEHINFFNIRSFSKLVARANLFVRSVIKTDIHGTSYVFIVGKKDDIIEDWSNLLREEDCLYYTETYKKWVENAQRIKNDVSITINTLRNDGYKIYGYGAAAKGNTFLNYCKIKVDLIIDDNPAKQNKYTPGTNIPIHDISILNNVDIDKLVFLPLAWNFFDEIKSRIKLVRNNPADVFVKYFPNICIV